MDGGQIVERIPRPRPYGHFCKIRRSKPRDDTDDDDDYQTYSKIAWYANDGKGQFGPQQVITTEAGGAMCVYAADLDGDGDLDVLSASYRDDKIAWYENE